MELKSQKAKTDINKIVIRKMPVREFLNDHKYSWWIMGLFLFAAYGIKVFNVSISHDTEAIMAVPDSLYGSWLSMGRFGLIALKKLLGTYLFNPYAASAMMFVMMIINGIAWEYLFCWLGDRKEQKKESTWIFPTIYFTSMIVAEQSGFLLQAYEVNVAFFLIAVSVFCLCRIILEHGKWYLAVPAIGCPVIAFASYQAYVPLFMAAAAVCFVLIYDTNSRQNNGRTDFRFCVKVLLAFVIDFVVAFGVYQIVNKIIMARYEMQTTSYISDQIAWKNQPLQVTLNAILEHIGEALQGKGIFFTALYGLIYVVMLIYIAVRIRKKEQSYWVYMIAVFFSGVVPFFMTVLLGGAPSARTEIVLPFIAAFYCEYLVKKIRSKDAWRGVYVLATAFFAAFCMHQSMMTSRLYYTQYTQYEEDVRVAAKISDRIEQLNLGETPTQPVMYVGRRAYHKNNSCIQDEQLELIGRSYFAVSFSTNHGTWVMHNFMSTLGYDYKMSLNEKKITTAEKYAADMPTWPAKGSVALKDGIIIVNLGR